MVARNRSLPLKALPSMAASPKIAEQKYGHVFSPKPKTRKCEIHPDGRVLKMTSESFHVFNIRQGQERKKAQVLPSLRPKTTTE